YVDLHHSDDTPVVALSTGWFNRRSRCLQNITVSANGRCVVAMCDKVHDYQPPCANNIFDASKDPPCQAVWEALGVPSDQQGEMENTWSEYNQQLNSKDSYQEIGRSREDMTV
ncbi:hypothetical protein RJ641_016047, partial [Dillenia turbinata]